MHLVLVSSLLPVANPTSGFDIANRAVLDGLVALGHRVSVIGFRSPEHEVAPGGEMHLLGELEVANARVGAATKLRWLSQAVLHRTTVSSAKMLRADRDTVETLLRRLQPFDGIVLNSVQLPGAFASSFQKHPTIYVAHNVEAQSALENARTAAGAFERLLFRREARHLARIETSLARHAAAVWTFAKADRYGFGAEVVERARVLPLVTRWTLDDAPAVRDVAYDLALIGTWSWRPNRIGLDWFLNKVVPLLPSDMSIAIAGQLPEPPAISHPGVRLLGRVADARAFVEAGAVVPLISRGGTGVQLKTIETFELGMPSVATQASLRGIGALPANCGVADDPLEFARLLQEKVSRARSGDRQRLSGSAFHQAQKTALLSAMEEGLAVLARPVTSLGLVVSRGREVSAGAKKVAAANFGFAVHEGGNSR